MALKDFAFWLIVTGCLIGTTAVIYEAFLGLWLTIASVVMIGLSLVLRTNLAMWILPVSILIPLALCVICGTIILVKKVLSARCGQQFDNNAQNSPAPHLSWGSRLFFN